MHVMSSSNHLPTNTGALNIVCPLRIRIAHWLTFEDRSVVTLRKTIDLRLKYQFAVGFRTISPKAISSVPCWQRRDTRVARLGSHRSVPSSRVSERPITNASP